MKQAKVFSPNILFVFIVLLYFIAVEAFTTGRGFFFTSIGWVDHWHYLGHFEYTPVFEPSHLINYKSSRLLWVWQGHLIFKFLSYPVGHYFLVIYSLCKFWLSFWLVAKEYVEDKKYIIICMCIFMFYPTLKQNGGWYYHNLEASSWWLLAIYFLRIIEKEKISNKYLLLSGLFAGFAINTNLFYINFLPIFIILCPKLFFKNKFLILYAIAGLASSVLLIGLINVILGGKFEYYMAIYKFILEYRGGTELYLTFVNTDSFKLFMLLTFFSGVVILKSLWIYKKNQQFVYQPLVFAFLYTSFIYLFWHLRLIEVLSLSIFNPMLLLIGFLMLMKVGESVIIRSPSIYLLGLGFFIPWFTIHYASNPINVFENYSFYPNFYLYINLLIVSVMSLLFLISFKLKNIYLWIFSLSFLPYAMASYREYPDYSFFGSNCNENAKSFETIFDMKNEIQKISAPKILDLTEVSALTLPLDYISMHSKWPLKKYFDKDCMVFYPQANKLMSSLEFPFLVKVSSTRMNNADGSLCKTWADYKKVVIKKKYEQCSGEIIELTIYTTEK